MSHFVRRKAIGGLQGPLGGLCSTPGCRSGPHVNLMALRGDLLGPQVDLDASPGDLVSPCVDLMARSGDGMRGARGVVQPRRGGMPARCAGLPEVLKNAWSGQVPD